MTNEFSVIIEKDGAWFVSYCPEVPGANGQGKTKDECLADLKKAVQLILQDRREDAWRGLPVGASKEKLIVN